MASGSSGSQQLPGGVAGGLGGLGDPVLRWFADTRASLALDDGDFPDWFRGLAARKDAEKLLKDKKLGTFLVRLSDKIIGYILSYRGLERCRHFVITQNQDGLFVLTGDNQAHGSIIQLIEHYKTCPIQPFGEYLTSSCHQTEENELYDVVIHSPVEKPRVSVRVLQGLYNQRDLQRDQRDQQPAGEPARPPPALPPKSIQGMLTGTVSAGAASQRLPAVPRRGLPLVGSSPDATSSDAQSDSRRRENPLPKPHRVSARDPAGAGGSRVEGPTEEEGDSILISGPTSSTPPETFTCQTYSLEYPGTSMTRSNPLYQTADRPRVSPAPQGDGTYAEVLQKPAEPPEDNYESLEDVKAGKSKSTWGKNNVKWRKFLNDCIKK